MTKKKQGPFGNPRETLLETILSTITNLTLEELHKVNKMVVFCIRKVSAQENSLKALEFKVGDMVEFKGKRGVTETGKITKINRTRATVRVNDSLGPISWLVPFSMLKKATTWLARQEPK